MSMNRLCIILALAFITATTAHAKKPLKVYILVGQSNMQGHAKATTIPSMALDPASKALHAKIVDENGKPRVYKNVSIAAFSGKSKHGPLTVGYGGYLTSDDVLGPELGFGITMGEKSDEPILLIKTSWGGKSLHTDFRSPSAGKKELAERDLEHLMKKNGYSSLEEARKKGPGHYYRLMMKHTKTVLADPGKFCAAYDPKQGYEIAGFVWFQGFNDMIASYPLIDEKKGRKSAKDYSEYSRLLACLIRDVREELKTPKIPFVIGVIGTGGGGTTTFRQAMAAPAEMPEFKGNVAAVNTAQFWDPKLAEATKVLEKMNRASGSTWGWSRDSILNKKGSIAAGWDAVGVPDPTERQWRFTSFKRDPEKQYRPLNKGEKGDEIIFYDEVPDNQKDWYKTDFDDTGWKTGLSPIGKGIWDLGKGKILKNNSDWGDGDILLMRTTFELPTLNYLKYRVCIMAKGSYHLYLNGQKIKTYVWYNGKPAYRAPRLSVDLSKLLKKGTNHLALYTNLTKDRGGKYASSVDVMIEGMTEEGKVRRQKLMDSKCPPEIRKIAAGASNKEYHYMGSAKIYSRIGEAFADAMMQLGRK